MTGRRLLIVFLGAAADLVLSGSADTNGGRISDDKWRAGFAKCSRREEAALEMNPASSYSSHCNARIINSLEIGFMRLKI